MLDAYESCQQDRILTILNLGFPPELPLCIKDTKNEIVIERTYCVHLACEYGFLQVLKELIISGCNLEALDSFRRSPLMVACEAGNLEIVQYLTATCKVNIKGFDYLGNPVLHIAALNGQLPILKYLIDSLGLSLNTLNRFKKTALALCRDSYALTFNPAIEKTLSYLIFKNSQNEVLGFDPNSIKAVHLSHFNCHEMCKEKYCQETGPRLFRSKLRSMGNNDFMDLIKTQDRKKLRSKKKIRSEVDPSFEQVVNSKCDLVYRKMMQDQLLPKIDQGELKSLSCQSSPVLRIKHRRFQGALMIKPSSCKGSE